jgi:Virulence factor BrkB
MLVSLIFSAGLAAFAKYAGGLLPWPAVLLKVVELLFTTAVLTALFAMIFRILPETQIDWRDVWIGALATSALFAVGKYLISVYIGTSLPASAYGAAGSVVVLIAWVYYSALILISEPNSRRHTLASSGLIARIRKPLCRRFGPERTMPKRFRRVGLRWRVQEECELCFLDNLPIAALITRQVFCWTPGLTGRQEEPLRPGIAFHRLHRSHSANLPAICETDTPWISCFEGKHANDDHSQNLYRE